jgi:hypothetical protein
MGKNCGSAIVCIVPNGCHAEKIKDGNGERKSGTFHHVSAPISKKKGKS